MIPPSPRQRIRFRFAIVAAVCLLLGAVTTVGVAWRASMQWPWPHDVYEDGKSTSKPPWPEWAPADSTKTYRAHLWRFWPAFQRPWARSQQEWFGTHTDITRYTCGWPLPALESHGTVEDYQPARFDPGWSFVSWQTGLRMVAVINRQADSWGFPGAWATARPDRKVTGVVHFPLLPIFPGFALDTALYSSAWYLLLFTPLPLYRAGRRRLRVSRGLCPVCAYDLKGAPNGPCPECGFGAMA